MKMTKTIKRQIEKIRVSGVVNMLLTSGVQRAAFDRGYYELVNFIDDHRSAYVHYIFTGEELPDEDEAEDVQEEKVQYRVTITETLKFTVDIDADSAAAAERIAEQNWKEGNYIIDSAHFAGVDFHAEKD